MNDEKCKKKAKFVQKYLYVEDYAFIMGTSTEEEEECDENRGIIIIDLLENGE